MRNKWMDDPVVLLAPCILNWESSLSVLFAFYLVSALVSRTHWIHISCWGITGGETRRSTAGISWSLCSYRSLLSQHSSPSFCFHLPVTCSETFTSIWLNVLPRSCPEMAPGSEWGTFPCKLLAHTCVQCDAGTRLWLQKALLFQPHVPLLYIPFQNPCFEC